MQHILANYHQHNSCSKGKPKYFLSMLCEGFPRFEPSWLLLQTTQEGYVISALMSYARRYWRKSIVKNPQNLTPEAAQLQAVCRPNPRRARETCRKPKRSGRMFFFYVRIRMFVQLVSSTHYSWKPFIPYQFKLAPPCQFQRAWAQRQRQVYDGVWLSSIGI